MIGHNRGPSLEGGTSWRRTCWQNARAALLPHLPLEVLRLRRAGELGLDYRTYAGFRARTGHDILAFLFSSNALRQSRDGRICPVIARDLGRLVGVERIGLQQGPLPLLPVNAAALDQAHPAPPPHASWSEARRLLRAALGNRPADRAVLVLSPAPWEADWSDALRPAGILAAESYFAQLACSV